MSIVIELALVLGCVVAAVAFYVFLARRSKDNRQFFRALALSASVIFAVNVIADLYVQCSIAGGAVNWLATAVLAVFHSLEIFVFQTHFFDNGYQEFFFGTGQEPGHPMLAYLFVVTFIFAGITSLALVVKAFNRRRAGRVWLEEKAANGDVTHVFFSSERIAMLLAEDIRRCRPQDSLILVAFPDPEDNYADMSLWERMKSLFRFRVDMDKGPFDAVVYSSVALNEISGEGVCRQMNLGALDAFLKRAENKVYFLSAAELMNIRCAELLRSDGCVAEIYCHACGEGINRRYAVAMEHTPSVRTHFVDSSYLALRNLFTREELLPVNFVEKGRDENGLIEGWVASDFAAMVVGFGETGREALRFLYEYAAFVGKDRRKSPFSCLAVDGKMHEIQQEFCRAYPGLTAEAGVSYLQSDLSSDVFWKELEGIAAKLNYVVVSLGDDRLNLKLAIDIVEFAHRKGRDLSDKFVVLVEQKRQGSLDELTLDYYNSIDVYHSCIKTFGAEEDVWTYDNITNESVTCKAKRFFAGYNMACNAVDYDAAMALWDAREHEIATCTDLRLHEKRVRQRSQDYANCFHVACKRALMGPEILDNALAVAAGIPGRYDEKIGHCTHEDGHIVKVMDYHAVYEHVRWEASHVALGYAPGPDTDEILKTHKFIMAYDELSGEIRHYDYLVVKTTLGVVGEL